MNCLCLLLCSKLLTMPTLGQNFHVSIAHAAPCVLQWLLWMAEFSDALLSSHIEQLIHTLPVLAFLFQIAHYANTWSKFSCFYCSCCSMCFAVVVMDGRVQ